MQIGFYFNQKRCSGCFTCMVACKDWHDLPAGPVSRITVSALEKGKYPNLFCTFLATMCYHCSKPKCMEACPSDAIKKREHDGIVIVDKEACTGCGLCKEACPYGVPQFIDTKNMTMEKCDFCVERLDEGKKPICVDACPMRALDCGPMDELREKYGDNVKAEGFRYIEECGPSFVIMGKMAPDGLDYGPSGTEPIVM